MSTTGPSAWSGVPGSGAASSVATGPPIGIPSYTFRVVAGTGPDRPGGHPMTIPAADDAVVDDTAGSRFVISEGGAEAELIYVIEGDRMLLVHTEVPEAWGGRG